MPRVVQRAGTGRSTSRNMASSPLKGGTAIIPLNDDTSEKALRLQSRQALHDLQMNQIKAAASPMRKLNNYERAASSSPKTPTTAPAGKSRKGDRGARAGDGKENDVPNGGIGTGGIELGGDLGSSVTPMKRVPILANFEEWMKMATDNKINATNSWNFALIDYFHDMSLLKEGDGVNFQKASCTLDGCVKIYTSRVDSVATETGKLLSGLADSGSSKKGRSGEGEGEEGEGDDEDGEEEGEGGKKKRKKTTRAAEATLAPSFSSLQLKKFELEFGVDPLFKKASADFDEGGAKGLLLNHLAIDGQGRIVFDSSDDAVESEEKDPRRKSNATEELEAEPEDKESAPSPKPEVTEPAEEDGEIDIATLASKFFPDLDRLDEQDICPSLKTFDLGDPAGSLDIPFLKAPEDWKHDKAQPESESGQGVGDRSGIMLDDDNAIGFDDDDGLGGFDLAPDAGFGEGGEVWAKEAALEPMLKVHRTDMGDEQGLDNENADGIAVGEFDPASNNPYAVSLNHKATDDHENILSYFDNALHKNWAGPEHWRIRRIKESTTATAQPRQRKEKEPFEIDFAAPLSQTLADMIYTPANSNSSITLPKSQWRSKTRNLLPDDKHFNSRQLLRLFLKPKARLGSRRSAPGMPIRNQPHSTSDSAEPLNEEYWATHKPDTDTAAGDMDQAATGDYDANFFNDDDGMAFPGGVPDLDDDDDNFADAREAFSPGIDGEQAAGQPSLDAVASQDPNVAGANGILPGGFGSQLVTQGGRRLRPEYVNYARIAKKVDVRRLKENLWRNMEPSFILEPVIPKSLTEKDPDAMDIDEEPPSVSNEIDQQVEDGKELKFTSLMNGLQSAYPEQAMKDISTSYCFICLLHLANEKGLVLQGEEGLEEIRVMKDRRVDADYVGE